MIANLDVATGIHYGVIPAHVLGEAWYEDSTVNYTPTCPDCGSENVTDNDNDTWTCLDPDCEAVNPNDHMYGDEPSSITYEDAQYTMSQDSSGDVFVLKSPYYTYCRACSPCAPNAGYVTSQTLDNTGIKTYVPGPEWLESYDGMLTIYDALTDKIVESGT